MLSYRERQRVKAEEALRQSLQPAPASKGAHRLAVLNSPFTIWLLSSILLGFGGWIYAGHRDCNTDLEKLTDRHEHLAIEVFNRAPKFYEALLARDKDWNLIEQERWSTTPYTFDEYKNRTLFDLIFELEKLHLHKFYIETVTLTVTVRRGNGRVDTYRKEIHASPEETRALQLIFSRVEDLKKIAETDLKQRVVDELVDLASTPPGFEWHPRSSCSLISIVRGGLGFDHSNPYISKILSNTDTQQNKQELIMSEFVDELKSRHLITNEDTQISTQYTSARSGNSIDRAWAKRNVEYILEKILE